MRDLLAYATLDCSQQQSLGTFAVMTGLSTRDRLAYLAYSYELLLQNQSKLPKPHGHSALKDN